jgi:hypothetical protein
VQTFSWGANLFLKHKHFLEAQKHFLEAQTFSWGAILFLKREHFLEVQTFSLSATIFCLCSLWRQSFI